MRGSRWTLALLAPVLTMGVLVGPATSAEAAQAAPTVVITAHSATATQYGSVNATAKTDPAGNDYPASMSVFLNGVLVSQALEPGGFVTEPVPCDAPVGATTCSLSMAYPVGTFVGTGNLVVSMTTAQGHVVSSAPTTVDVSIEPPTVGISVQQGWKSGAPLPANVTVTQDRYLDLAIDGSSDWEHQVYDKTIELLVDGVAVVDAPCLPATSNCGSEYFWQVSKTPVGMHTFQARLTLMTGEVVLSTISHIQVDPAPATLTLTKPLDGATVSGIVTVTATGSVTAGSADSVSTMTLYVNGNPLGGPVPCPTVGTPTTCTLDLSWDARALPDGPYNLLVQMATQTNYNTGASVSVQLVNPTPPVHPMPVPPTPAPPAGPVLSGPVATPPVVSAPVPAAPVATRLALSAPHLVTRGAGGQVSGTVTDATTGAGVAGVPVALGFTPAAGRASFVSTVTDARGRFVAADPSKILVNTDVVAFTGPSYGSLRTAARIEVGIPMTCRSAPVRHRTASSMTCAVRGLATGTVVTLHYSGRAGHGALASKVAAGSVTFTLATPRQGWVTAWVTTAASRAFTTSHSRRYAVHIS